MFLERYDFVMTLVLFYLFFQNPYGSDMLSSCIKFLDIEETNPAKKTSIVLFGIKYKQLHYEQKIYCVFIIVKGNDHATKPFNNSLL